MYPHNEKPLTAPDGELHWNYTEPADRSRKMLLLTRQGVAILGPWEKGLGLVAWCPLPRRNRTIEDQLSGG